MQIIKDWLEGNRNFIVGKTIYNIIGDNPHVRALLDQGETPFAVKALTDFLVSFSIDMLTDNKKPVQEETMPPGENEILVSLQNKWKPLYQRMNYLRHQLDKAFSEDNSQEAINYRQPIAKEILEIEKEITAVWKTRDFYLKNGKLPGEAEKKFEAPADPVDLATLIGNTKRNIRHNRKLLRENPGNERYAALVVHYKRLYTDITGGKVYEEKN